MKLSEHFKREEFACPCGCGFDTVDAKLLQILERVRVQFNSPVIITSGCRCEVYNSLPIIGGAKKSLHLWGKAADIVVKDVEPKDVYEFLCRHIGDGWAGIMQYEKHVHFDVRDEPWRESLKF